MNFNGNFYYSYLDQNHKFKKIGFWETFIFIEFAKVAEFLISTNILSKSKIKDFEMPSISNEALQY